MDDTREADGSTLDVQRSTFNVQHPAPDARPTRATVWIATAWIDAAILDAEAKRIYEEIAVPAGKLSGAFNQEHEPVDQWEHVAERYRDIWRAMAREVLPLRYRWDEILSTLPEILAKLAALEKRVIEPCDKAAKP